MHSINSLPPNVNQGAIFSGPHVREIYLAGGCFWGVEAYLARIPGVCATEVGYANGHIVNPSYEDVCAGNSGFAESVRVSYDSSVLSLADLLKHFFSIIDPTSVNRQGNDVGSQYRTGIYYVADEDVAVIVSALELQQAKYARALATEMARLSNFYPAENYHQKYLEKNPGGYCHISFAGLRAPQISGYSKSSDASLKQLLTPEQYSVTQQGATEQPFSGQHWQRDEKGLYVDVSTGEPLFLSRDKFASACGWPSFSKPIAAQVLQEHLDNSHGMRRVEVKSRVGQAHLGHVFADGPAERGGMRYCINSAALEFIPYEQMQAKGYGQYKHLLD